jgi:hypothetical protein
LASLALDPDTLDPEVLDPVADPFPPPCDARCDPTIECPLLRISGCMNARPRLPSELIPAMIPATSPGEPPAPLFEASALAWFCSAISASAMKGHADTSADPPPCPRGGTGALRLLKVDSLSLGAGEPTGGVTLEGVYMVKTLVSVVVSCSATSELIVLRPCSLARSPSMGHLVPTFSIDCCVLEAGAGEAPIPKAGIGLLRLGVPGPLKGAEFEDTFPRSPMKRVAS